MFVYMEVEKIINARSLLCLCAHVCEFVGEYMCKSMCMCVCAHGYVCETNLRDFLELHITGTTNLMHQLRQPLAVSNVTIFICHCMYLCIFVYPISATMSMVAG